MLDKILRVGKQHLNKYRVLYVMSMPPYDIHRFAIKLGQNTLSKKGKSKRNQLVKRLDLLRQYHGQYNEVYACHADTLQCHNTFCQEYLTKLNQAYTSQDTRMMSQITARDGVKLNQFCINYFGDDYPRIEELVQQGNNLLLPYRSGALSALRASTIEKYVNNRESIEELVPVYPWRVFIEHEKFREHLEAIHNMYQKNPRFREAVNEVITIRIKKLTADAIEDKLNLSPEQYKIIQTVLTLPLINYSFEELAVWMLWNDAYTFTHVAYPGKLNLAFEFIKQLCSLEFINTNELEELMPRPAKLTNHHTTFFPKPPTTTNTTNDTEQPSSSIVATTQYVSPGLMHA